MDKTEYEINQNKYINDIREHLLTATRNKLIPGAVITIYSKNKVLMNEAFGCKSITPFYEDMQIDSIFDIASLTKIVATWISILKLQEQGKLNLNSTIKDYLDINDSCNTKDITIFDLLTHTSGLSERTYLKQYGDSKEDCIRGILNGTLENKIGNIVTYSNKGFILLGEIIEKVSGYTIDKYAYKNIWGILGMKDTFFNPPQELKSRISPTEYREYLGRCQHGEVHDENATHLGGVAGHAGVFSTVEDLTKFCSMIVNDGIFENKMIINNELINLSFKNYTNKLNESRGLGWKLFDDEVYGHYGFTGTAIWVDEIRKSFLILLTNRVHPYRSEYTNIQKIRNEVFSKWRKIDIL